MFSAVSLPEAAVNMPSIVSDSGSEDEQVVIGIARDPAFGFYYRECVHSSSTCLPALCSIRLRSFTFLQSDLDAFVPVAAI